MPVQPYLHFEGTCEAALAHYADALGGSYHVAMRYGEAPPETGCAPEFADRVMHAMLEDASGPLLLASDTIDREAKPSGTVSLAYAEPDVAKAKAIYAKLADGGTSTMPIQPVFWGGEFGMLTDRYGMTWLISAGQMED